jgi:hypothetical protein
MPPELQDFLTLFSKVRRARGKDPGTASGRRAAGSRASKAHA